MATTEIKAYTLILQSGPQAGSTRATIHLYADKEQTIGVLGFVEDTAVPEFSPGGMLVVYYPIDRYADVVDLLRNERPVYLVTGIGTPALSTRPEPVGDAEGSTLFPFKPKPLQ